MVTAQVMGNHVAVTVGGCNGDFELNVFKVSVGKRDRKNKLSRFASEKWFEKINFLAFRRKKGKNKTQRIEILDHED